MKRVVVVQSFWGGPSNQFLVRNLEMLRRHEALAAVGVLFPTLRRRYGTIPVVSLSDPRSVLGTARWLTRAFCRRVGLRPAALARRPEAGLSGLLKAARPDVVFVQYATTAAALWDALEGSGCELFIHLHGADTHPRMCPEGHRGNVVSMASKATLVCNSFHTRDRMLDWGVPQDRMAVKYPGVEVPSAPRAHQPAREVTILQLGRLVRSKGPERTIRAFELACERGLRGRLVVAGDGPLREECRGLISRSRFRDRMQLRGTVGWEEGRRLRLESDIYTQHNVKDPDTGQIEAFGVAVVEAMAEGLPVVGTRSGGVVETVIDGENGVLVEPGDEEAQAEAFLRLASAPDERERLGRAGWARARDRFSVELEEAALVQLLDL